jgi:hypothetical protein
VQHWRRENPDDHDAAHAEKQPSAVGRRYQAEGAHYEPAGNEAPDEQREDPDAKYDIQLDEKPEHSSRQSQWPV